MLGAIIGVVIFYVMLAGYVFFVDDRYYNSDLYWKHYYKRQRIYRKLGLKKNRKSSKKNQALFI